MAANADSSPSPKSGTPRSQSPQPRRRAQKDLLQPHHALSNSPLRTEQSIGDTQSKAARSNGDSPKPTPSSVRFAPITEGFPFNTTSIQDSLGGSQNRDFGAAIEDTTVKKPVPILTNGTTGGSRGRRASDTAVIGDRHTSDTIVSDAGGPSTPPGRRSVQFARPTIMTERADTSQEKSGFSVRDDVETPAKDRRGGSLISKLRALAGSSSSQTHVRSPSNFTVGGDSIDERFAVGVLTPDSDMQHDHFSDSPQEEDSEVDADGEQSTAEDSAEQSVLRNKRRKSRRPQDGGAQTAPTTPKTPFMRGGRPSIFSSNSNNTLDGNNRLALPRRRTMTDIAAESRQGVSEDEGRDRLSRGSPWQRGNAWVHGPRGMSYSGSRKPNQQGPTSDPPRPSNFRRALTGFGASSEGQDGFPFSPWKRSGDRSSSFSAAKWRSLMAGMRMFNTRRKPEITPDHVKSAELLAELTAGVPAALILASMFQRDEHGNKRIPILLEQLKLTLTDSKQVDTKSGDRHMVFRIELEYGNGLTRMKWVIHRSLRDFANLHARYKLQISAQKLIQLKGDDARTKLPHFPRSAFPYLRGIRGLDSESEEEDEAENEGTAPSGGEASGTERPAKPRKRRSSLILPRRKSSVVGDLANADGAAGTMTRRDPYAERQRRKLEVYLQRMIRFSIFRPESNRLCKFLELSALGVRLAAEGSYHGKEGHLILQSGRGVDFRKAWKPSLIKGRHGPKWFLVRHSYIVCVDSPQEMNIYDVFLVDSDFSIAAKKKRIPIREQNPKELAKIAKESATHPQHHRLKLSNSEREFKLIAKNERQLGQFEDSIRFMASNTPWILKNRFDSFAPVRSNVFAQWLVDGRDYMWNVSRAISMAKDVIYIHDWWLSPELYMRRPAAISQKWRLDRLLKRKAEEGVKVFVIMYRNIQSAIPIDSEYSKFSLLDLHANVFVQRSPNQIRQGTFFWAHHEKICIVDHMIAFVGGIDLCFGRWDTPQHVVVDDKLTGFEEANMPKDADHCQLWPGKDYSNPRVQDFYALDKPYEEMYDRSKIPRMPWHDISMQVVGQPARDLTRHFVQRWNYVLRQRRPTRPTPFLLPPPDFNPADLEALGLDGTCEVQILRSCCMWSMGTPARTEHSIMNAYIKMIQQSDHFVYIENQFFISSTKIENTIIENTIGDALVERIVRASKNNESWRAIIMIPLMPGFQNTVDSQDGTSVRLIMQCQFRSINRGPLSIFGRLRAEGIEPEDYIQFYSLRSWGKIGPTQELVTEQLYIHAKCMVVDDRIAIIGSANINERSMLGSRDSECAAVVRDTDMLWSTMNGEPYLVGRFPHTLRMRLMREHLGVDVDKVMEDERQEHIDEETQQWERDMDMFHGEVEDPQATDADREAERRLVDSKHRIQDELLAKSEDMRSFNHDVDWEEADNPNLISSKSLTTDPRVMGNAEHRKDVDGEGPDHMKRGPAFQSKRGRDTRGPIGTTSPDADAVQADRSGIPTAKNESPMRSPERDRAEDKFVPLPPPHLPRMSTAQAGLPMLSQLPTLPKTDDTDIGGPSIQRMFSKKTPVTVSASIADIKRPVVDQDCMRDPLNDSFFIDTWHTVAENNTKLFRTVFRCMPDNEVKNWKEYKEYAAYAERFSQAQGGGKSTERAQQEAPGSSGPPGIGIATTKPRAHGHKGEKFGSNEKEGQSLSGKLMDGLPQKNHNNNHPLGKVEEWAEKATRDEQERHAKESMEQLPNHGAELDEKVRISNDHPKDLTHPYSKTSNQDPEKCGKANVPATAMPVDVVNTAVVTQTRKRRTTTRSSRREFHASDDMIQPADAQEVLKMVQGHLILWPYDWYVLQLLSRQLSSTNQCLCIG